MTNIQKTPNFIRQTAIFFPEYQSDRYWQIFLDSELGRLYQTIPFKELAQKVKKKRKSNQGAKPIFDEAGELGLMFLKSYSKLSDAKLIERLNTDIFFQFFCGIYIPIGHEIKDKKLPSQIRCNLADRMDIFELQKIFAEAWSPYMKELNIGMHDATCYETSLRYPTSIKILWESVDWVYGQLKKTCKALGVRRPRSKYSEQKNKTLAYQKQRRKTHKQKHKRATSLVYLLKKIIDQLENILSEHKDSIEYGSNFWKRLSIINKVYLQQNQWFTTGQMPKDLIVSIDKHYIRPIVRGKENKRVEFGAKVNMIQVDGINFIERISFSAFHEGIRLPQGVELQQFLFGKKVTLIAADALYATNKNRTYCSTHGILTNFVPKGRKSKDESSRKQLRTILNKERSTRLEGSFGVEKEIYGLKQIKARTDKTEELIIFFGIFTANSVRISKKIFPQKEGSKERA